MTKSTERMKEKGSGFSKHCGNEGLEEKCFSGQYTALAEPEPHGPLQLPLKQYEHLAQNAARAARLSLRGNE